MCARLTTPKALSLDNEYNNTVTNQALSSHDTERARSVHFLTQFLTQFLTHFHGSQETRNFREFLQARVGIGRPSPHGKITLIPQLACNTRVVRTLAVLPLYSTAGIFAGSL